MKSGDRVRAKAMPEIEGTIVGFEEDRINVTLDNPLKGGIKEGFVTKKEFEQIFELIEESDWTSIWDDSSS